MDKDFINGNDEELKAENSNEEFVLFKKEYDEELSEENMTDDSECVPETEDIDFMEAADEQTEDDSETEADVLKDETLVERKEVEAPAKSKGEKTQTILFFVIIAIGIAAVVALLVVGIITVVRHFNNKDVSDNSSQIEEEYNAGNSDSDNDASMRQDYSNFINEDGTIKDIKVSDYVELCDYKNIVIDYNDIKPSDSEVQEQLDSIMSSFNGLNTETDALTQLGDTVNIDYVGYVDGVAFDGGNTQGQGADLELGSRSYIDDFEEQLVGYKVGDSVTVEVTFPENYGKEELNGKDAIFEVVINGIYTEPELTDDFVKENLSEYGYGSTVEELKAYIEESFANNNKQSYVWDYVLDNSNIKEYPSEYYQNELAIFEYELENQYNYYSEYYSSMYGQQMWNDIYEFYETDEAGYADMVKEYAESSVKQSLIVQAIAEESGVNVSDADVLEYLSGIGYDSSSYDSIIEQYGKGYVFQNTMSNVIEKKLLEGATVQK